ncbi:MAG: peptidylprolyl isomerase [Gemmatimonadetes bacterium]|nr:peptidylprolyl isomerase [Gemmatimonadota bacterium]MDA1103453.1 peptidylprolyl isomerase [Gemmatimonadota bacterium]
MNRRHRRAALLTPCALLLVVGSSCAGPARTADPSNVEAAPDSFVVGFETSAGDFSLTFYRAWSPAAVDRVYQLAQERFWEGARIYRVNDRYAQFGYSGRPGLDSIWVPAAVPDEPVRESNVRGAVSFARGGPDTRSAIIFINRSDNSNLDDMEWNGVLGFPPVGRVSEGMDAVDRLYSGYGDEPMQWEDSIASMGNSFFDREYPELDRIRAVRLLADGK